MSFKYFLFCFVLFTATTFVNAQNEPCPNPQASGIVEIPSITANPHIVEILVFGNCTEQNGGCELTEFNVRMRTLGNGTNHSGWLSDETVNPGGGGSTTIFATDISWTSQMNDGVLTITVTATHDGVVVDTTTITIQCRDNIRIGCCDLPPYGCAGETTEFVCNNMGGVFMPGHTCIWMRDRPRCAILIASGSGSGAGSRNSVEETKEDSELQSKQLSLDFIYNAAYRSIQLNILVPESNPLNIQIYNLMGQPIYQQSNDVLKGRYSRNIQLSANIPTGIYFINVHSGNQQITQKIIIRN